MANAVGGERPGRRASPAPRQGSGCAGRGAREAAGGAEGLHLASAPGPGAGGRRLAGARGEAGAPGWEVPGSVGAPGAERRLRALGPRRRRRGGCAGAGPLETPRAMRGPAGGARAAALALLLGALHGAPAGAEEYDYYGWQAEPLHGRSYSKPPQCLDIPADLPLCHTVGYKRMRLPNLLEHESLAEVKQQASSWLPLLAKRCHSDTQVFLCSLFAPVCLDRPIYPCRSLCEAVRAGCAPLMEAYGFPWPEMLHCHKFPLDNDLCIAMQFGHLPATAPPVTKICTQCEMEHSADGLMEQMCSSDFVVKMRIKEIKLENGDRKLIGAQKKKKLLKPGPLKRKDTKRLVLHMKNGASCPCPQLDSLAGSFLVMGRKVDGQLLLMAVYRWDKKNKEMKFAVKFMFSYPCSLYYPFFYGAAEPH
ncbi:secreted frizzled-related protein 5 isoform X3 [Canis lupus familiaris]|uniref:Secreted frizzled-related protein 5 n=3 Tax=Canis lupus familiaris TaxID=9615 RepID=A0A8C0P4A7_CANLF|nr:secreted frizzled-related protein 5 isoform X3 [Canis lupus familiaris]